MKKIGLAVCYDTKNFGSQLQVYATNYKIRSYGYDCEIIRYKKALTPKFILQTIPRFFNPYFLKSKFGGSDKKKFLKQHQDICNNITIRNKKFSNFVKENYDNLSEEFVGWESLVKRANKKYDAFLCGSDQLWLPSNLGSHFYTLEFANKSKPKIAYATSFGVSQIPWFQKYSTRRYLNNINYLSSREQKGKEIIKNLTGRDSLVVCDPTLLLSKTDWDNTIKNNKIIDEDYIFCYFLGTNEEHRNLAIKLSDETGLKIVTIPFLDNYNEFDINFGDNRMYDVDSFDFVNLIRNAKYVLTDSFHGSIFSIINHKQFIVLNRFSDKSKNSRNSRIDNLCNLLGLNERRYTDSKEDLLKKINKKIDYNKVDKNLIKLRKTSEDYLQKSLKEALGDIND